ncbi:hypothetical protein BH09MYX1_BH09MYX1_14750 [soil metagenome]
MKLTRILLAALVMSAIGCKKKAPAAAPSPHLAIVTRSDDEGVFLAIDGPKLAKYEVGTTTFVADEGGHAAQGIVASELPATGVLPIKVTWGEHETVTAVEVPFTEVAVAPYLSIGIDPTGDGGNYLGIEVTCSGACSGTATFVDGLAVLQVMGTSGCDLTFGPDGPHESLTVVPVWDRGGTIHRKVTKVSVDVGSSLAHAKLPAALEQDVVIDGKLTCPHRPGKDFKLVFGRGAAVSALRALYHQPEPTSYPKSPGAVIVHGARFLEGLDLEHDLVRFIGKETPFAEVTVVAKIKENPQPKETCTVSGTSFDVELRNFDIEVTQLTDKKFETIGKFNVNAPPKNCQVLATQPSVTSEGGDDVRIVRPSNADVDAVMADTIKPD